LTFETIIKEVAEQFSTAEQIRWAVAKNWSYAETVAVFGASSAVARCKREVHERATHADYHTDKAGIIKSVFSSRAVVDTVPSVVRTKAAVPAASTASTSALYYPKQAPGVLLPPVTQSLITQLANGGAAVLPPNTRLLTQAALLTASELEEGAPYPAAAPSLDFQLTSTARKFGIILAYSREMLAAGNFDDSVRAYVEGQLNAAADNATDGFFIELMTSGGTAAASVAAAMAGFAGDLRSAVWIGSPETLATLQDAPNPNIGPAGGMYKTLPALASMAAPVGKLYLIDRKRVAVYDGALLIAASDEASIVMDSAPGTSVEAATNLFQTELTALKVTKYADANLLSAPTVISLT
jgi:hypothetical protein